MESCKISGLKEWKRSCTVHCCTHSAGPVDKHKVCLAETADSSLIETKAFIVFEFYDNYAPLEKILPRNIIIAEGYNFFLH